MRRTARVTIATAVAVAALAAPGAAPAAGPLDDLAERLGCRSGHDGIRCTGTSDRAQQVAKSSRSCRRGTRIYLSCMTKFVPLRSADPDRLHPGLDRP